MDVELRKLEWRCRRGMKELDVLLVRYLRNRLATGISAERGAAERGAAERVLFAAFLELPDPQIARYLIAGDVPDDPEVAALCRDLLQA